MNTNNQVCLYIATHNKTGLKYFGKTTRYFTQEDLQSKYHGSGVYWNNHLKVHGDDVTMEIYGIYNLNEVEEIALKFSSDNNIVKALNESDKKIWANEKPENGKDGGNTRLGHKNSLEHNAKISKANKYRICSEESNLAHRVPKSELGKENIKLANILKATDEFKKKISNTLIGHKNNTLKVKRKISNTMKAKELVCVECPHCGKVGQRRAMGRWHFNNCKNLQEINAKVK